MTDPLEELLDAAREASEIRPTWQDDYDVLHRLGQAASAMDWAAYRLVKKKEMERLVEAAEGIQPDIDWTRSDLKRADEWPVDMFSLVELAAATKPFREEEDD